MTAADTLRRNGSARPTRPRSEIREGRQPSRSAPLL